MNLISSFSSVQHLNDYFIKTLQSENITHLTPQNATQFQDSFEMAQTDDIQKVLLGDTSYYIYSGSFTNYRKIVHSNIPPTLFKAFNLALKKNRYIVEASTVYVLIHYHKPFDEDFYNLIYSSTTASDQKLVVQFVEEYKNLASDNDFYISYISSLEKQIINFKSEIDNLNTQVYNKSISTWY